MSITQIFRKFTYGDQFSPTKTPLPELLELCNLYLPSRTNLQVEIQRRFFSDPSRTSALDERNAKTLSMNCLLSLNAYGVIKLIDNGRSYKLTDLFYRLLEVKDHEYDLYNAFAIHILLKREGLLLARLIERIRSRGEQVTLEYMGEELIELGIKIPINSTYISTMREWLAKAGVFRNSGYEINWDVVYSLLNVDADIIDKLYELTSEQKFFLLSMISLDIRDWIESNNIANHTRSVYKIRLTTKSLVSEILEPLRNLGLIETRKTTEGRGAKPHNVRLTPKAQIQISQPLIENLARATDFTSAELNRTFESVVGDLSSEDKHVRGIALELLAVWMIRLLGLRFSKWRLRSHQSTGGGEVDVMAASDKIIYNRWQVQCKNQKSTVGVDVIAKEVGLTFLTRADVVMVVTTSTFASDAINYANQVNDNSRYYVILLEGSDIERIVQDRSKIVDILNIKARRVFAKRELGMSDLGDEIETLLKDDEYETEEQLEKAIEHAATQLSLDEIGD